MSLRHVVANMVSACRRALRLLARPLKGPSGPGGLVVQPYRGYGSEAEVFLMGRVFRQTGVGARQREGTLSRDVLDIGRRLLRRGIGGAVLVARFGGTA
jgi:hypothetical protein